MRARACASAAQSAILPAKLPLRDLVRMSTAESAPKLVQPNAQNQYNVTPADLPLSCPMPGMYLWNSHPRVFLPIEKTGWAKCPYCSAEYTLQR